MGAGVGARVGALLKVGPGVGCRVGAWVGAGVGATVGAGDGCKVGTGEGTTSRQKGGEHGALVRKNHNIAQSRCGLWWMEHAEEA